jgi:dTDP-4-amino-4,6-dideoxygalactose transaminase
MTRLPLLVPKMPTADQLAPWLRLIDENRHYTNFGPLCTRFEARLRDEVQPRPRELHLTTVSNCTVGLELALQVAAIAPGARVLIPAITFVATATAVIRAGFVPVIADVDAASWALTPAVARAAIAAMRVDAVMPVSTFGYAHDVAAWDALTRETGVPVVIDAAGAFGNQGVGETTDVVFSFHATKSFAAAEGGAVCSADAARIAQIRKLSNFGIDTSISMLTGVGTNGKMSEYHCALGLASFDIWESVQAARRDLSARYARALASRTPAIALQRKPEDGIYPLLPVLVPADRSAADAARALDAAGIDSRRWYCPPLHQHPALAGVACAGTLVHAEDVGQRILGLPFFVGMTDAQVERVVDALASWL